MLPIEAITLLKTAVSAQNGMIIHTRTLGRETIQSNGQNFTENADARTLANWRDALDQLFNLGLITQGGSNSIYQVTRKGYEYADALDNV